MKNKVVRTLSCMTAAFMVFASVSIPVCAAEKTTKEETVYVITEETGEQRDLIVSDHLHNPETLKTITDTSGLRDIENVKGEESFKKGEGEQLIWQADGKDIYYQGKTEKDAPVTLDIQYYLNGSKISGKELEGKDGEVRIVINYHNNCSVSVGGKDVKVPFIAMTGFLIEDDSFSNITVSSGKVVDDGEKQIVALMAAPGLAESLGVSSDKIGLSDSVEITGTAKDFSLEDMMTVITSEFFNDIDAGKLGNLDMDDQIKQLDSGASKLVQGSTALYDGIHMLSEKAEPLVSGITELNTGAQKLSAGAGQTLDGSRKLAAASVQLSTALDENLGSMKNGAADLYNGSLRITGGLQTLQGAIDGSGTAENPGLKTAAAKIASGAEALQQGISNGTTGSITVIDGIIEKLNAMKNEAGEDEAMKQNCDAIIGQLQQVKDIQKQMASPDSLNSLVSGAAAVSGGLDQISSSLAGNGTAENPGLLQGAQSLQQGIAKLDQGLGAATAQSGSLTSGARELSAGAESLMQGQTAVNSGAAQLAAGMAQLYEASGQLSGGIKQLDRGAMELSKGMKQLYSQGIKKIVELYNSKLKGITGNVDDVIKAGQQYKTFTQLPDTMDGNVRFIYKTEISEASEQ